MFFYDFEYDGKRLSDFGFVVCSFNNSGLETRSIGSTLSFNTSPILSGGKFLLANVNYEEALSATFYICPNPCADDYSMYVSEDKHRQIVKWINRKKFLKFKPLRQKEDVFFEGSFNVQAQVLNGHIIGYELALTTNRPYGLLEAETHTFTLNNETDNYTIDADTDDNGYIYANCEITCLSSGDMNISNGIEDRVTTILNCTSGEVISMSYPIISSSLPGHKIQNDFDYNFIRIASEADNQTNTFTSTLPCTIKLTYNPVRKVGI